MIDADKIKSQVTVDGDEATLDIFDAIGVDFWGEGISAKSVNEDIKNIPSNVGVLNLRINSPGGSVFDGMSIFDQLARFKGKIKVDIIGQAASMAAVIAMVGHEIEMSENSLFMIHEPFGPAFGQSKDLRATADLMDKEKDKITNILATRSGNRRAVIRDMLADETWFNAKEAVDAKFVDRVSPGRQIAACAHLDLFKQHKVFRNVPEIAASANVDFESKKRELELLKIKTQNSQLLG